MAPKTDSPPSLHVSEAEAEALALHDQVQQLELELAFLQSQKGYHHEPNSGDSQMSRQDLAGHQARLLEAKAVLGLRNSVVEGVIAVQPVLNAVHHATHASPVERDLLGDVKLRDEAAVDAVKINLTLQAAHARLAELEIQHIKASRQNTELASEVLSLARSAYNRETVEDLQYKSEISLLEEQVKSSRHRWRVMKGAAGAIVAGSGIEWVRDERLRHLVLDPPD